MFSRLVNQMAEAEGVNEELKSTDQMVWVKKKKKFRNGGSVFMSEELFDEERRSGRFWFPADAFFIATAFQF